MKLFSVSYQRFTPFVLLLWNIFIREVSSSFDVSSFVGSQCTITLSVPSDRSYNGVCKYIKDCPSVISNLRAGIVPTVCVQIRKVAVICCPSSKRISEEKCEEYNRLSRISSNKNQLIPLLATPTKHNPSVNNDNSDDSLEGTVVGFIVGGTDAQQDEYPHMVALGYGSGPESDISWWCGGTLVTDQHVITAGHCLDNLRKGPVTKVLLGDLNTKRTKTSPTTRVIADVIERVKYPEYTESLKYHDIAIIKLAQKVKLSKSIRPACLPRPSDRQELAHSLIATGWGNTEFAGSLAESLQKVQLSRYSQAECKKSFVNEIGEGKTFAKGILSSQFCAGESTDKDTCEGDSGGPLGLKNHTRFTLVGITSIGSKFCGYGTPAIYTNVQSYLDWIEETLWPGF